MSRTKKPALDPKDVKKHVKKTPRTLKEIAEQLGEPVERVRPAMNALREEGVVEMLGEKRNATWALV